MLVDGGLGHLTRLHRGGDGLRRVELPVARLHVEPVVERLHRGVRSAEVRQHEAVEAQLALEDVDQQRAVLAGVLAVDAVERAHGRAQAVVDRGLPRRGVDLLDRPLVGQRVVGHVAVELLRVEVVVLEVGDHAAVLDGAHVRADHAAGQQRVLALALVGAAPPRIADDVAVRAEQHVATDLAHLVGDGPPVAGGEPGIEGGRQQHRGRHRRRAVARLGQRHPAEPQAASGVEHPQRRDAQALDAGVEVRPRRTRVVGHQLGLLLQGHLGDEQRRAAVRRQRGIRPRPLRPRHAHRAEQHPQRRHGQHQTTVHSAHPPTPRSGPTLGSEVAAARPPDRSFKSSSPLASS